MLNEIVKGMDNAAEKINENFEMTEIESGSNQRGNYTKFPTGIMICSTIMAVTHSDNSGFLNGWWDLPQEFKDTNFIVIATREGLWEGTQSARSGTVTVNNKTTTRVNLREQHNPGTYGPGDSQDYNVIAIGTYEV